VVADEGEGMAAHASHEGVSQHGTDKATRSPDNSLDQHTRTTLNGRCESLQGCDPPPRTMFS
jgi:hypothetical protein